MWVRVKTNYPDSFDPGDWKWEPEGDDADPTFRADAPERVVDRAGKTITIQRCESLEDGRWEPFVSIVAS